MQQITLDIPEFAEGGCLSPCPPPPALNGYDISNNNLKIQVINFDRPIMAGVSKNGIAIYGSIIWQ